jgi:hypothetical protein
MGLLAIKAETFKATECRFETLSERYIFDKYALLRLDVCTVGRVDSEVAGIRREVGKRRGLEVFTCSKDAICCRTALKCRKFAVWLRLLHLNPGNLRSSCTLIPDESTCCETARIVGELVHVR